MTDQETEFKTLITTLEAQARKLLNDYHKMYPEDEFFFIMNLASVEVEKSGMVIQSEGMSKANMAECMINLNEKFLSTAIRERV